MSGISPFSNIFSGRQLSVNFENKATILEVSCLFRKCLPRKVLFLLLSIKVTATSHHLGSQPGSSKLRIDILSGKYFNLSSNFRVARAQSGAKAFVISVSFLSNKQMFLKPYPGGLVNSFVTLRCWIIATTRIWWSMCKAREISLINYPENVQLWTSKNSEKIANFCSGQSFSSTHLTS